MRAGEIMSLAWENVDLSNGVASIIDTKNGDRREIPLSGAAVKYISQLKSDVGKLFSVKSGSASTIFRKAKKNIGLTNLRFHDSRSEGLTRPSKKVDVLTLARIIGHRDPRSLMIYYNMNAEEVAKLL